MWKFEKTSQGESPFKQIASQTDLKAVRTIIYHLDANRVECAGFRMPNIDTRYQLNEEVLSQIKGEIRNSVDKFAILAFDDKTQKVFFLSAVPSLDIASACLLAILGDILSNSKCNDPIIAADFGRLQPACHEDRKIASPHPIRTDDEEHERFSLLRWK